MKNPEVTLYNFVLEKARAESPEKQSELYRALARQFDGRRRDELIALADHCDECARRSHSLQLKIFSEEIEGIYE
ncbi:MAG: hypothetical protein ACQKBU_02790 [Verrucomicrobiales bacterium]